MVPVIPAPNAPAPVSSAGLLAYRISRDGTLELLIVHPGGPYWAAKDDHAWSIPKGEYEPGEDPPLAAEREFAEELGMPAPDGVRIELGEIRQPGGKRIRAWAVHAPHLSTEDFVSNEFEMEWPPRSGRRRSFPEVDRAEWVPVSVARTKLLKGQLGFVDRLLLALGGDGEDDRDRDLPVNVEE
jgi:predicted NUDIX family NTP pyrophosphohydrolase